MMLSPNLYALLRPLAFLLEPEQAHTLCFKLLKQLQNLSAIKQCKVQSTTCLPQSCMGLNFSNPVGLAAGLDKNAELIMIWEKLGFGFVEVGTITPKPQYGNPKPRLFRLKNDRAIINRMGFNNQGIDVVIKNLQKYQPAVPLGINIGKNKDTPLECADDDYLTCFHQLAPFADYITINLSSPNTPGLRGLQQKRQLTQLLDKLKDAQVKYQTQNKPLPICVKIAPDLNEQELENIVTALIEYKVEGLITTNTTITRPSTLKNSLKQEQGGLSGAPLFNMSNKILQQAKILAGDNLTIIGVGGIMSGAQAQQKFKCGADLVQIYSGFIYKGPALISDIKSVF